jgi:putative membrane protein
MLGFLPEKKIACLPVEEDHLEFPFANGTEYPKFTVKECLVERKGEHAKDPVDNNPSADLESALGTGTSSERYPNMPSLRFPLEVEMHDIMRKDSSGLKDYDDEEGNFAASKAVMAKGKKAAGKLGKATGLNHVVSPIRYGLASGMNQVSSGMNQVSSGMNQVTSGMNQVVSPLRQGIASGMNQVSSGMNQVTSSVYHAARNHSSASKEFGIEVAMTSPSSVYQAARNHSSASKDPGIEVAMTSPSSVHRAARNHSSASKDPGIEVAMTSPVPAVRYTIRRTNSSDDSEITGTQSLASRTSSDHFPDAGNGDFISSNDANGVHEIEETETTVDPDLLYPEQNIDIDGPSSGKKLTDEFAEIKDKMHEVTWHLFNDKTYVMKNPDSLFFGQGKKPEKRRKAVDVSQKLDKLLHVGQYSHSNPFIARLGLFGEPIISSVYSFLCLFRAIFNVYTWRDPMLTFWLSIFGVILAAILFIFPWRIFLFVLGIALVGPQNWAIRVLRARGRLPPIRVKPPSIDQKENEEGLPTDQPIFCSHSRQHGNAPSKPSDIDSREVQRIVVPYNPLIYQRFYDWPPEPQYAQVKADHMDEQQRKNLNASAHRRTAIREVGRIRRRFHRRPTAPEGMPPLNPRRRVNTGDWQTSQSSSPTATSSVASSGSFKKEK